MTGIVAHTYPEWWLKLTGQVAHWSTDYSSTLRSMKNGEIAEVMETVAKTDNYNTSRNVSCVTVIPSMRDEDKDKFVQGIEKFIDTMQGEKFTAVFIAKPVPKDDLEMRKRGFEELYSSLSPFIKTSLAYGENYSKAVTSTLFLK